MENSDKDPETPKPEVDDSPAAMNERMIARAYRNMLQFALPLLVIAILFLALGDGTLAEAGRLLAYFSGGFMLGSAAMILLGQSRRSQK